MEKVMEKIDLIINEMDTVMTEGRDDKYEDLFKKMLNKYEVNDPDELDKDEKEKFFDEIKEVWTDQKI